MTEESRKGFRELLRKKDLDGIESFWLELLESEPAIAGFLELVDTLLKGEQRELATTLLSVLISHRKEHGDYAGALEASKRQAELNPNDRYLRREIIACYRQIYSTNPRLDTYISKSELADNRPVPEAIQFLENCLAFDVDGHVYDSEQGMGKVTELDLMVDKIVVNFGRDKPVTYHISAAFKHLVPLKPDHFLIRKRNEPEKLRELGRHDPLELLKTLLRGFDRPLKPREIKEHLSTIVAEDAWDGFWSKASKAAIEDPEVRVLTRPERSYQSTSSEFRVPGSEFPSRGKDSSPTASGQDRGKDSSPTASEAQSAPIPMAPKRKSRRTKTTPEVEPPRTPRTPRGSGEPEAETRKPSPDEPKSAEPAASSDERRSREPVSAEGDEERREGSSHSTGTGALAGTESLFAGPARSDEAESPSPQPSPVQGRGGERKVLIPSPSAEAGRKSSEGTDLAEPKPATPRPKVGERIPLPQSSADDFAAVLKLDASPEHWKKVLASAQQALPKQWPQVFRQAFLETTDKRIWALIIKQLGGQSAVFQELVREVTTYYKRYAAQFLYLQQNAAKYGLRPDLKGLLSRLLDLLDSDRHKTYWAEINDWLAEGNDLLVRECFRNLTADEAEAMWQRISRTAPFKDFRKDELRKAVQSAHPGIGVPETKLDEIICCTKEGIERKQAELRQLLDVEIPKTSEDIGRARSFGDLSDNYEYKAAREKQARLLAKVAQVQRDLAIARPIDFEKTDPSQVGIGTKFKVEESPSGEVQEFTILGPWDIDPDRGIISYQAPFAQRLLGKRVGDFVPANPSVPTGRGHKILEITKAS